MEAQTRKPYIMGWMPENYHCRCGKTGVRLWRHPHTNNGFTCYVCGCELIAKQPDPFFPDKPDPDATEYTSQFLGECFPAVPHTAGYACYGYLEMPPEALDWWRNLPLR